MNKHTNRVRPLCAALSAVMILLSAAPAMTAGAAESTVKQEVTTFLYSAEQQTVTECLFTPALPEVPYMRLSDYFSSVFTVPATETKNADGTYTVANKNGSVVIDPAADTLCFDRFDTLISNDVNDEGSLLETDFAIKTAEPEGEEKPFTIDLSAYGIDILEDDGSVWLPVPTMNDIAVYTYNTADYVDEMLYFTHSGDALRNGFYYDRSSLYRDLSRTSAIVDYTYRELCFAFDYFYGRPSKAAMADSIAEKGFDAALDSFSDQTRKAKALLQSTDTFEFCLGMTLLTDALNDGGHTATFADIMISYSEYPGTAFSNAVMGMLSSPKTEDEKDAFNTIMNQSAASMTKSLPVENAKENALSEREPVMEWEDGAIRLLTEKDTAVFMFDSFVNEAVAPFKWSLDYAKGHHFKNFVVDLSTNGGGSSAVLNYMMALMTNQQNHTNQNLYRVLDVATGYVKKEGSLLDLNLDGVFDDRDKEVCYDFNFAVITTKLSFSCGNLMPVMCRDSGICLLGETSGGGSCISSVFFTPESHFYALSGPLKLLSADGKDVDFGAEVDYQLVETKTDASNNGAAQGSKVYDKLYDFALIDTLVKEFYAKGSAVYGDVDYDGDVTINDATLIQKAGIEMIRLTETQAQIADVNGDGRVSILDVTCVKKYLAEYTDGTGRTGQSTAA